MSEITLYYMPFYGRLEATRMLLHHAKVNYEEKIIPLD